MARDLTHSVFVTLGASNHSTANREQNDFYATDPRALECLLELESFSPKVWECACGAGHLSKVLEEHGYEVLSTDLIDRGYGYAGIDFLATDTLFDGDIITNPPYKYAQEFVAHAIDLITEGHRVAMFLKLQFLEGQHRRALFDVSPPKYIYVASGRFTCLKNGSMESTAWKGNGAMAYGWFIWEKPFTGEPTVRWFN